ncbi:DUF2007 domain-containing protein [Winogradskyella sp. DF17]|uniref:DUF2007 domain-containing protein n=1 Tax=Winogradskyella pelagia TaxID=2819984 RepID=A0ABS3T3T3_9FLAO|nr:DUF2007 domain-containing protein [Winogradskyella sp. DF17]MBO3117405.1 DUF2007 domain-containing protein [Winogradskyella sp. DF17]
MNESEYTKIFESNFIMVTRVKAGLENIGITPIIKDQGESQRLGGQGSINSGWQEVFVHNDELEKAQIVVEQIKNQLETES